MTDLQWQNHLPEPRVFTACIIGICLLF